MNNFSTTLIIAFVIYVAAYGNLANYAKIATTNGWSVAPPSGSGSGSSSSAGSALSTAASAVGGIGSIVKAIPLIGNFF